ncbi:MAG: methyltransferase domain-containing protein [Nitrospirota bacterium]
MWKNIVIIKKEVHMEPKPLSEIGPDEIKRAVSERYGLVATDPCGKFNFPVGRKFAESVGYSPELLDGLPAGFWESFTGAGNPQEFADAKEGETLLDIGCGAGLDLYMYSRKVGPSGKVSGLDISGDMLGKARANLLAAGVAGFELIEAPSDNIPLPAKSVDIVTANGIYNLSPDKDAVMREVYRVLKDGGRTVFAEIMLTEAFKMDERKTMDDWFRCIGGALPMDDFLGRMKSHGFRDPKVLWSGRNARTGHKLAVCAVIKAWK